MPQLSDHRRATPAGATTDRPALTAALLDAVAQGAGSADAAGDLVGCHDQLVDHGLFHLLVPAELGGPGCSPRAWFDTALAVAEADPSAGWIMAQGAVQTAWIAVAADRAFARSFLARRQTIASSSAGNATAERRHDSYLVRDARWAFVSGCQGAAYLGGMVRTTDAAGDPESRMVLVKAEAASILRTWDTHGLRGTGSHDVHLGAELVVPAAQTFPWPALRVTHPGPLGSALSHTLWAVSVSAAAVNLGAARRAAEVATESAEGKLHRFESVPVAQQQPFLRAVAEMHGQLDLAVAGIRGLLEDLWGHAEAGTRPTAAERARLRLAAAAAVELGAGIVQRSMLLLGADAFHRSHPLERLGRDSRMLLNHVAVSPSTREQLGRVLLDTYQGPAGFV